MDKKGGVIIFDEDSFKNPISTKQDLKRKILLKN